jgi:hypothetical protein
MIHLSFLPTFGISPVFAFDNHPLAQYFFSRAQLGVYSESGSLGTPVRQTCLRSTRIGQQVGYIPDAADCALELAEDIKWQDK